MEFMELCKRRQSCRSYADRPVEREKLTRCIEAARLAPSACNSQPWSFVVVVNPALLPEVAKCTQQLGANGFTSEVKAFIVVLEEHAVLSPRLREFMDSQYFAKGDLGGAALAICLEAEAQGLGTCIMGLFNREGLCNLLDIPKEKRFFCVIAVGYPASDKVRDKIRKPLEEIVRFA